MNGLICRSKVRAYALDYATRQRPFLKLARVSGEFLDDIEARVRNEVRAAVDAHNKGKTLKGRM